MSLPEQELASLLPGCTVAKSGSDVTVMCSDGGEATKVANLLMDLAGKEFFDNTPTVVVVLVPTPGGLMLIKRGNEPRKGFWALPGGYHMKGETWQAAGAREVLEETGQTIDPNSLEILSFETDEYGNNLVIAVCSGVIGTGGAVDGEAEEIGFFMTIPNVAESAFPRHYAAMQYYFNKLQRKIPEVM